MNKIAFIYGAETRRLRKIIRKTRNKELYRRANAVLLVLEGHSKAEVARVLHAGRSSVIRWMTWYESAGAEGLKTKGVGRPPKFPRAYICGVLKIMLKFTQRNTGYQRSHWRSELFALLLQKFCNIEIHSSTIRRWLPQEGIVWRSAAPTLYIQATDKSAKFAEINEAFASCNVDNPVFYQDEVDIHLNPKSVLTRVVKANNAKSLRRGRIKSIFWRMLYTAKPAKSLMWMVIGKPPTCF